MKEQADVQHTSSILLLLLKSTGIKLLCQIGVKIPNAYSQCLDFALCGLVSKVWGLSWVQDHTQPHLDSELMKTLGTWESRYREVCFWIEQV